MVMQHVNFFRNLDTVIRELEARGHDVVLLHGTRLNKKQKPAKMVFTGRGIEALQSDIPRVVVGYRPEPSERWQRRLQVGRQIVNRATYLRKSHPAPDRVAAALDKRMSTKLLRLVQNPLGRFFLRRRAALALWRVVERLSRPSKTVTAVLDEFCPDVVLVSPSVWPKRPVEADYIRAARGRGIPTAGYLNSWDNLTSKGTLHVLPDAFIVWNEALAAEAQELHDVPRSIIHVTGAPHLDRLFEMRTNGPVSDVRALMGVPPTAPYVVYLCSSRTLISSETHIVDALADALTDRFPEHPPTVVVRPHPVSPETWDDFEHAGVIVHPRRGDQADTPEAWQEYYDQLADASCFIGLNTTAFLEAAVVDKPCLTIVADEFRAVQALTGHFRHLLSADFLEVCGGVREVADRVARILDGADEKAAARRAFTEFFLRPRGIQTPATDVVVDTLLAMSGKKSRVVSREGDSKSPAFALRDDSR